jgi:hypothetical protein
MTHHQANDLRRVGQVGVQGVGAELDLVTEQHRGLEGVTGATEEAKRRRPPRGRSFRGVSTGRSRQVLTEDGCT